MPARCCIASPLPVHVSNLSRGLSCLLTPLRQQTHNLRDERYGFIVFFDVIVVDKNTSLAGDVLRKRLESSLLTTELFPVTC